MIIPIRLPSQVAPPEHPLPSVFATLSNNETIIIEFQGSIETEGDDPNQVIALLDMSNEAKPTLRVGHHLLEGKITTLSKPLAVLKSEPNDEEDASSPVSLDMVAIIRKKIMFSKRPSPIVVLTVAEEKQEAKRKRAL